MHLHAALTYDTRYALHITHYYLRLTHYTLRITHYTLRITDYTVNLDSCFRLFPIFYNLYEGVNSCQHLIVYFCTELNYLLVCVLLRDNLGVSFCATNFLFPQYKCLRLDVIIAQSGYISKNEKLSKERLTQIIYYLMAKQTDLLLAVCFTTNRPQNPALLFIV